MKTFIQRSKVTVGWIVFFIVAGAWVLWQWIKAYWYVDFGEMDFGPKPVPSPKYKKFDDPDRFSVDYYKRLHEAKRIEKEERVAKELDCWELLIENRNHYKQAPHVLLKTSSLELASYVMNNLVEAYKDYGYNTFTLYIKSVKGGIIVKEQGNAS